MPVAYALVLSALALAAMLVGLGEAAEVLFYLAMIVALILLLFALTRSENEERWGPPG
jgi:hypothetical protein